MFVYIKRPFNTWLSIWVLRLPRVPPEILLKIEKTVIDFQPYFLPHTCILTNALALFFQFVSFPMNKTHRYLFAVQRVDASSAVVCSIYYLVCRTNISAPNFKIVYGIGSKLEYFGHPRSNAVTILKFQKSLYKVITIIQHFYSFPQFERARTYYQ